MENHKEKLKNKEQNLIWNKKNVIFFFRCRPHFCLLCLEAIKSMLLCHTKAVATALVVHTTSNDIENTQNIFTADVSPTYFATLIDCTLLLYFKR